METQYQDDYNFIQNGIKAIKDGTDGEKKKFFEQFYARYEGYIRSIIAKKFKIPFEEQDDIVHELLLSIWDPKSKKLTNYKGDSNFKTYLYAVTVYFIKNFLEKENRYQKHNIKIEDYGEPERFSKDGDRPLTAEEKLNGLKEYPSIPDEEMLEEISREEKERLYLIVQETLAKALLYLSRIYPIDAQIIIMEFCEIDRKEIAKTLGISEDALKKRITRIPYGVRDRFQAAFKQILLRDYNLHIDVIKENLYDIRL